MPNIVTLRGHYYNRLCRPPNDSVAYYRCKSAIDWWRRRLHASLSFDIRYAAYEQRRAADAAFPHESEATWQDEVRRAMYVPGTIRQEVVARVDALEVQLKDIEREPIDKRERLSLQIETELIALNVLAG